MSKSLFVCIAGAACALSGAALGQEATPPAAATAGLAHSLVSPAATKSPKGAIKSDEELESLAGGRTTNNTIALTEQDLTAANSGNTITAGVVGSGAITLSGNAFSDFNGVGNIIMNTGHNNNLQSSMSVTVIITP